MGGNLGPSFLFLLLDGGWVKCVSCDRSMASPSASWVAFRDDTWVGLDCSSSGGASWWISVEGDSSSPETFPLAFLFPYQSTNI